MMLCMKLFQKLKKLSNYLVVNFQLSPAMQLFKKLKEIYIHIKKDINYIDECRLTEEQRAHRAMKFLKEKKESEICNSLGILQTDSPFREFKNEFEFDAKSIEYALTYFSDERYYRVALGVIYRVAFGDALVLSKLPASTIKQVLHVVAHEMETVDNPVYFSNSVRTFTQSIEQINRFMQYSSLTPSDLKILPHYRKLGLSYLGYKSNIELNISFKVYTERQPKPEEWKEISRSTKELLKQFETLAILQHQGLLLPDNTKRFKWPDLPHQ